MPKGPKGSRRRRLILDADLQAEIDKARIALQNIGMHTTDRNIIKLLTGKSFNATIKGKRRKFDIEIKRK